MGTVTVIAAYSVEGVPVVFGDLLITGPSEKSMKVGVPAIGSVQDFFGDSGWAIVGLSQKVVVVRDDCVLAWAGSWLGARVAIADLRALNSEAPLTAEIVGAFLSTHEDVVRHGTAFVGWVHEKQNKRFGQFRHDAEVLEAGPMGRMSLQGSGASAIKEFVRLRGAMAREVSGDANPVVLAATTALSMAGMLLRAELHGGDAAPTLRHSFGGGYEVATFSNGKFTKLGDLTFLVWSAFATEEGVSLSAPQFIYKQTYLDDVLLVRSARMAANREGIIELVDEQYHLVNPMYETDTKVTIERAKEVSYDSPLLCHCFVVTSSSDSGHSLYTRIQRTSTSAPAIKMQDSKSKLVVSVHRSFLEEVVSSIRKRFAAGSR